VQERVLAGRAAIVVGGSRGVGRAVSNLLAGRHGATILDTPTAEFEDFLDSHLGTVFQTCRAAAPKMGGAIVNTGSFAFLGDYGGTGYPAGKGAVNALTLSMAGQLKDHGVRANVVCPGARTRLSSGAEYESHINKLNRRGLLGYRDHSDSPPSSVAEIHQMLERSHRC
jgi:NAD(P)-dependent dehydrogenase (short-subunit alcohol dehydrogenase family)